MTTILPTISGKPLVVTEPGQHQIIVLAQPEATVEQLIVLAQPGVAVDVLVFGAVSGDAKSYAQTRVIHQAPETTSQTLVKGVVKEHGQLNVSGAITLQSGAKQAKGRFQADILLVGPDASAESFPILEVAENDVQAAHGAAIGRVNAEQLFYLQSRGLSAAEAEAVIVAGFFEPMLANVIDTEVKKQIIEYIK